VVTISTVEFHHKPTTNAIAVGQVVTSGTVAIAIILIIVMSATITITIAITRKPVAVWQYVEIAVYRNCLVLIAHASSPVRDIELTVAPAIAISIAISIAIAFATTPAMAVATTIYTIGGPAEAVAFVVTKAQLRDIVAIAISTAIVI
jgi:hypothetical protein